MWLTKPSELDGFDKDFRSIHDEIIDLFEEESADIEKEHEALDKHEDAIFLRLQRLSTRAVRASVARKQEITQH